MAAPLIVMVLVEGLAPQAHEAATPLQETNSAPRSCPESLDLRQLVLGQGDLTPLDLPLSQCNLFKGLPVLHALNKSDLRLVRNAIYARRGRRFKSQDLSEFFARFRWYSAEAESVDDKLTPLDRENVRALLAAEKRKRTALPSGHLGVVAELRSINPSDADDVYVLLKGGEVRYDWKNPNDERHYSNRRGRWELDWPYLFIWWTGVSGAHGVGKSEPLPGGVNAPNVYREVTPFEVELKSTLVIDWKATESAIVESDASRSGLGVKALRAKIGSSGKLSSADGETDSLSDWVQPFETRGEVKCSAVACRSPLGQPCIPCSE